MSLSAASAICLLGVDDLVLKLLFWSSDVAISLMNIFYPLAHLASGGEPRVGNLLAFLSNCGKA